MVPKGTELKTRVLKVDSETWYKVHASLPLSVKYLGDRVEVTWTKSNLRAYEAYQFNW